MRTRIAIALTAAILAPVGVTTLPSLNNPFATVAPDAEAANKDTKAAQIKEARRLVKELEAKAQVADQAHIDAQGVYSQTQSHLEQLADAGSDDESAYVAAQTQFRATEHTWNEAVAAAEQAAATYDAAVALAEERTTAYNDAKKRGAGRKELAELEKARDEAVEAKRAAGDKVKTTRAAQQQIEPTLRAHTDALQEALRNYNVSDAAFDKAARETSAADADLTQAYEALVQVLGELDDARAELARLQGQKAPKRHPVEEVKKRDIEVGSFNVYFGLSQDTAYKVTAKLIKDQDLDILALQEFQNRPEAVDRLRGDGYKVVQGTTGDHLVFDGTEFAIRSTDTYQYSYAEHVGIVPGKPTKPFTRDHFVTVVRLEDKLTGAKLSVASVHMPAHVFLGGLPRDGASAARVNNRREAEQRLQGFLEKELARGDYVIAAGDWNVNWATDAENRHPAATEYHMSQIGMRSAWETDAPKMFTIGKTVLDGIYANTRAEAAKVVTGDYESDHRPIRATYEIRDRPGR